MIPPHAVVPTHQLGLQPCSFLIYGCLLIFFPRVSKITFFTTYSWAVYLLYLDMPIGSLNGLHYLARLPRLSMSDAITVLYVHLNTERTKKYYCILRRVFEKRDGGMPKFIQGGKSLRACFLLSIW